jgi:hypothetical protein
MINSADCLEAHQYEEQPQSGDRNLADNLVYLTDNLVSEHCLPTSPSS